MEKPKPREDYYTIGVVNLKNGFPLTYKVRRPWVVKAGQRYVAKTTTGKLINIEVMEIHTTPEDTDPTIHYVFLDEVAI